MLIIYNHITKLIFMFPKDLKETNHMIIGYYPLRGKAQVCRLLCEYLHIPYKDLLFTPKTWEEFKRNHNGFGWTFEEIPFLKDGNLIITETYPICLYILSKANRKDLLGKSLIQQIKVDSIVSSVDPVSYILTAFIGRRNMTPDVKNEAIQKIWSKGMEKKLQKMENQAANEGFFFGDLTLVDFYLYETLYFLKIVSAESLYKYPKLMQIVHRVANIPEIKNYEVSKKCIKQVCPVKFLAEWRDRIQEKTHN